MANKRPMTVDDLWAIERIGVPSLAPDARMAVAAVTSSSMQNNTASSSLWLFPIGAGAPRRLTQCGEKDAKPRFSPRGRTIAFTAKREQQGKKDSQPQLYLIDADGGEARRAGEVATGVDAFEWFPDGKRVAIVSWVWPDVRGTKAQAERLQAFTERKETGYATEETAYRYWERNLPMGRVARLHVITLATGKVRDLFEGSAYELTRAEPDTSCFTIAPDGKHVAFAFDPADDKRHDGMHALAECELAGGRIRELARDAQWHFKSPAYSPDGTRIAMLASHRGKKHTMPAQLAVLDRKTKRWEVVSGQWDHAVEGPLAWSEDGASILLHAEQHGRRHVWRFDLADRRAAITVEGGWVDGFDHAAGTTVSVMHSASHPQRLHAHVPGRAALRLETFNDARLSKLELGRVEERWFQGALRDKVQMWITYPPGFDAAAERAERAGKPAPTRPLMHVIHGGPHTSFGDAWHYRWNTQTFAAQGYVVACVNYHGSTSFGYAFLDSITHRWGELELQDVERATDVLLDEPWADARRVFATGGSYGGYMVAWMNGHVKPGRYAAYVCHAGCYDWRAMMATDSFTWFPKELGGWHWDAPERVAAQNPITHAGTMSTPTLVVHGALDYRVPDAQGLAYYNTLRARGVPSKLLWFPDENHWILKPRNSKQWYDAFFEWLERHDTATAAPASGSKGSTPLQAAAGKASTRKRGPVSR